MFKSVILTAVLLTTTNLQAFCDASVVNSNRCCTMDWLPELRAACFHPSGHRFRKIYSDTGLYSAEVSYRVCNNWYSWASIGYGRKSGSAGEPHRHTSVTLMPVAIGIKYIYQRGWVRPYIGAGLLGIYTHTHDRSPTVTEKISRCGIGAIVKSGLLLPVSQHVFVDLFIDYSTIQVNYYRHHANVTPHSADLSGMSAGIGIGFRF